MRSAELLKRIGWLFLSAGLLSVSACANVPPPQSDNHDAEMAISDPIEPVNRAVYRFNYVADGLVLRPAASIYRGVMPDEGREMVDNFINNIYTPVTFANSVLQVDPKNSFTSFWRFFFNTTLGVGGLFDFASTIGLKSRTTDFGQTLALYGVESGPYLVLPVIGPSGVRDATGRVADAFMNPFNYIDDGATIALWSSVAVNTRANNMKLIDDIYGSSLDPYATFRSLYTQKRQADIAKARAARQKAWDEACRAK